MFDLLCIALVFAYVFTPDRRQPILGIAIMALVVVLGAKHALTGL